MFIDRLLNQGNAPLLEQMLRFTEARHNLMMQNVANVDVPNYRQKDLDIDKFQKLLGDRVKRRETSAPGTVRFDDVSADVEKPNSTLLFHDGNNRSMEQLMADNAKNGLFHNLVVELLRKQYSAMESALRERVT